jgi:hypothetical protein
MNAFHRNETHRPCRIFPGGKYHLRSAFAGLSRKVVGSVRGMENKARTKTEVRDHIDQRVSHVTAWTTLLEALERKEDGLV